MDSDCLISLLHILSFGRTDGIWNGIYWVYEKKNEYFIFVTFKNNLLGINY